MLSGARFDKHSLLDNIVVSPRLSFLYKLRKETQFRLTYSTGFRAPQAFDTDLHMAFSGGGISRIILADDLILADIPCLRQMLDVFEKKGGNVLATMEVPQNQTSRYGIVDTDQSSESLRKIRGLIEKPTKGNAPSNVAIIGRYILLPEIFNELGKKKVGEGGEIQLTDALSSLIGRQSFYGLDFVGKRFDCGDKLGYLEANIAFALKRQDLGPSLRKVLTRYGF